MICIMPKHMQTKAIGGMLIAVTRAISSGGASTDWIDRTLVTADVTGTREGSAGGDDESSLASSCSSPNGRNPGLAA